MSSTDDWLQNGLPVYSGGKDRSTARRLIDRLGGPGGFKTTSVTNPDGSVTTVQLKGDMPPQVWTTRPIPAAIKYIYGMVDTAFDSSGPKLADLIGATGGFAYNPSIPDAAFWKTALNACPPSMFSGLMRKVVQVEYSRISTEDALTKFTDFELGYSFDKCHGIAMNGVARWVVEISTSGVYVVPVVFEKELPANWAALEQSGVSAPATQSVVNDTLNPCWKIKTIDPAAKVKIGDATIYAAGYRPLWSGCGWAFNYAGTKASLTCFKPGVDFLYSKTVTLEFTFGPSGPVSFTETSSADKPIAVAQGSYYTLDNGTIFSTRLASSIEGSECFPVMTPTAVGGLSNSGTTLTASLADVGWIELEKGPIYSYYRMDGTLREVFIDPYDLGYGNTHPEVPYTELAFVAGNPEVEYWNTNSLDASIAFQEDDVPLVLPTDTLGRYDSYDGSFGEVSQVSVASRNFYCHIHGTANDGSSFSYYEYVTGYFRITRTSRFYYKTIDQRVAPMQLIVNGQDRESVTIAHHHFHDKSENVTQTRPCYVWDADFSLVTDGAYSTTPINGTRSTPAAPIYIVDIVSYPATTGPFAPLIEWTPPGCEPFGSDYDYPKFAQPVVNTLTHEDSDIYILVGDQTVVETAAASGTPFNVPVASKVVCSACSANTRYIAGVPVKFDSEVGYVPVDVHGISNYPTALRELGSFIGVF